QRQLDLVAAGQGGDEVAGLEDETDPLTADPGEFAWRGSREVDVTQADAARGGRREGASHGEQARLAGSRRSDDGDDLARLDLQGDLVEGDHGVVAVSVQQGDVGQGQGAHRLPPSAVRGSTRVIRTTAIAAPTRPSTSNSTVAPMMGPASRAKGMGVDAMAAPAESPIPIPMAADITNRMIDWNRLSRRR